MDQRAAGFLRSLGRGATALLVACVLCASSCLPSEPYSGIGFRSDAGRATVLVLGCKQNPPMAVALGDEDGKKYWEVRATQLDTTTAIFVFDLTGSPPAGWVLTVDERASLKANSRYWVAVEGPRANRGSHGATLDKLPDKDDGVEIESSNVISEREFAALDFVCPS